MFGNHILFLISGATGLPVSQTARPVPETPRGGQKPTRSESSGSATR